jgi:CheY-like chemotaxis protein
MTIRPQSKRLLNTRVLVVDDSKDICFLWRRILEKHGAEVQTVESAEQAEKMLQGYAPDVIVSDLTMPGTDGFGFLQRLKQLHLRRPSGEEVPVLAVSGHDDPDLKERTIGAGFSGYVLKPVTASELVEKVAGLARQESFRPYSH